MIALPLRPGWEAHLATMMVLLLDQASPRAVRIAPPTSADRPTGRAPVEGKG